jgi:hypothetical protein
MGVLCRVTNQVSNFCRIHDQIAYLVSSHLGHRALPSLRARWVCLLPAGAVQIRGHVCDICIMSGVFWTKALLQLTSVYVVVWFKDIFVVLLLLSLFVLLLIIINRLTDLFVKIVVYSGLSFYGLLVLASARR